MENEYIKVKDKNYLYRDCSSEGIVNGDYEGYKTYIEQYKKRFNETEKIKKMEDDMTNLRNDIEEIKNLLKKLIK